MYIDFSYDVLEDYFAILKLSTRGNGWKNIKTSVSLDLRHNGGICLSDIVYL